MKTMRKLFATLLTVIMSFTLAVSAFAAPGDYTITITNSDSLSSAGHIYKAYQIFDGDLDSTGAILSNITWGENMTANSAEFLAALKTEPAFNVGGVNIFAAATTAADVASVLAKPEHHTSAIVKAFAKHATAKVSGSAIGDTTGDLEAPYEITIPADKAGYYLVTDTLNDPTKPNQDISDFILQVVADVTVEHKGSIPTVDKKVSETGSTFGDYIATGIGDVHTYRIMAELPDDYYLYTTYELIFTDTMSAGLTYDPVPTTEVPVPLEVRAIIRSSGTTLTIDPSCYTTTPVVSTEGATLTVDFDNLKNITSSGAAVTLSADDAVEVVYKVKLNKNAVNESGEGAVNTVKLEYSNNPNSDGTGHSSDDSTEVFPINLEIVKVDGKATTTPLAGAEFILMRDHSTGLETHKEYAVVTGDILEKWVHHYEGDDCATGDTNHADAVAAGDLATVIVTDATGKILVKGLDAGKFYLREITAPDGYNKLVEDIIITTDVTFDSTNGVLAGMTGTTSQGTISFKPTESKATITVPNFKGDVLPSTGGVGTTLFYLAGGALVLGAVVMMVTKKRMGDEE